MVLSNMLLAAKSGEDPIFMMSCCAAKLQSATIIWLRFA